MLQFPRWKVDVTVGGDVVKTFYETATTSAAAIAKAKHKMRGAVSSAGAFKFKATEAGEPERHHATKKSPAQLQREIDEALAKPGVRSSSDRAAELIANYPSWVSSYSNEDFDRKQHLAQQLTDIDRQEGRPAPRVGYSTERFKQAERAVRDANRHSEAFQSRHGWQAGKAARSKGGR